MTNPMHAPRDEAETARRARPTEQDPVLLALPPRGEESGEPLLEQLQVIETGCGPQVETAFLVDLLTRNLPLGQALADPAEVHDYRNPLAAVNAYKHRLHALRCEYVNARRRIYGLEIRLQRIEVLEKHIQFLDATLAAMRSSRGWQLVEKFSRWRRRVSGWFAARTREESSND